MIQVLRQNKNLQIALVAVVFLIAGFALYANSFNNELFWDDHDGITKNAYIKDWQYLPKFFTESLIAGAGLVSNYYRPVLLIVYSLEWHAWADSVYGYHVVNTLVHIANAVLIFLLLAKLFNKKLVAFLTALIFLIHPLQTEAVTYVSGLGDPLSTLFLLSGLLLFLKFRDGRKKFWASGYYYLSLFTLVLALLTKDPTVVMPGLIALVDFFYKRDGQSVRSRVIEIAKVIWPYLIIVGAYVLLRATVLNFQNTFNVYNEANNFTENFHIRLFTFFKVLVIYFSLLFWPQDLHMERTLEIPQTLFQTDVLLGALLLLAMLVLAFRSLTKYPILAFGIFWFLIRLFPNSNLAVPNSGLLYEHWMYLPMAGIFLIVFWLAAAAVHKARFINLRRGLQYGLMAIFIFYLIFFGQKTIARNNDWQDPITFYTQTLRYAPDSYRVTNNLAMAYADRRDFNKAIQIYQRAIELDPNNAVAYHNIANSYNNLGQKELAIENYEKALKLQPDFLFSYNALTNLYLDENNLAAARDVIERSIEHTGDVISRLFLLAQIAYNQGDIEGTKNYLRTVLQYDPNNSEAQKALSQLEQ